MLAAWYDRQGAASEVLLVGELPDPEPGAGEVRVRRLRMRGGEGRCPIQFEGWQFLFFWIGRRRVVGVAGG